MTPGAPGTPHWGFWTTAAWSMVIALVFVGVQIGVVSVLAAAIDAGTINGGPLVSPEENGYLLSIATFATTLACCALIALVIKLKPGAAIADYLALRPVTAKTFLKWLIALAVLLTASDALTWSLGRPIVPEFMSKTYASASPVWLFWLALIAAAPLFEEVFFRGFVYRGFAASAIGPAGAIFLTTLLWAVVHMQYDAYGIATIFVLGILFGAARAATGSLYVPLALHSLANLVATIETAIVVR